MEDQTNSTDSTVENKPVKMDPYALFRAIEELRENGMPEAIIHEAFNQFMEERQGKARELKNSMKRTPESIPIPTQLDINKMYEDRLTSKEYVGLNTHEAQAFIEAIMAAKVTQTQMQKYSSFRTYKHKIARWLAIKMLSFTIFVCKLLGVK